MSGNNQSMIIIYITAKVNAKALEQQKLLEIPNSSLQLFLQQQQQQQLSKRVGNLSCVALGQLHPY